jgi:hypothetical protein
LIKRIKGFKRWVVISLSPVRRNRSAKLLNDAWAEFWQAPSSYVTWEKREADKLGTLLEGN